MPGVKPPWASKINWLALILTLAGIASDPTVQGYFGVLIPQEIAAKLTAGCGLLVMVIRSCCTSQGISIKGGSDEAQ